MAVNIQKSNFDTIPSLPNSSQDLGNENTPLNISLVISSKIIDIAASHPHSNQQSNYPLRETLILEQTNEFKRKLQFNENSNKKNKIIRQYEKFLESNEEIFENNSFIGGEFTKSYETLVFSEEDEKNNTHNETFFIFQSNKEDLNQSNLSLLSPKDDQIHQSHENTEEYLNQSGLLFLLSEDNKRRQLSTKIESAIPSQPANSQMTKESNNENPIKKIKLNSNPENPNIEEYSSQSKLPFTSINDGENPQSHENIEGLEKQPRRSQRILEKKVNKKPQ